MDMETQTSTLFSNGIFNSSGGIRSFDPFNHSILFHQPMTTGIIPTITNEVSSPFSSSSCSYFGDQMSSSSSSSSSSSPATEIDDDPSFHYLIDILDDYATNATSRMQPDSETQRSVTINVPNVTNLGSARMTHHYQLPFLFNSINNNIWSNHLFRYHEPFDDDEFDPTQPYPSPPSSTSTTFHSPLSSTKTAIEMLLDLLPQYTEQQVISTLSKANYDMDRFLELLTTNGNLSYYKKRQVCRHFLLGDCHRHDCRYAHDISIKVCRFWLQGCCLKGNQCEFAHSVESISIIQQEDPIISTKRSGRKKEKQHGKRQDRKKSKRKSNLINNVTPIDSTKKNVLEDEFPALLKNASGDTSRRTSAHVFGDMCPTNFAQVVANSKR
ncbi:uncharacterized protein BX664DRAFT_168405 [Halteromyces radiatus]|uniref:uncharacterized protein n=1 Tax=Halteromyces radiatus TaxID=101107 RepID=UPI002220B3F3|nr:uncharacterized protein BX664DRAFT_168405 [Halteromyces radiatus]KAI8084552.1 hypothetical protein BX664DRAFT_168405 [Halteromyces radiatus]